MSDSVTRRESSGFTLIELLIVVAIIAILAAIAVPNFLEAQMRARVSRVKADLRTVKTGLETYFVDNNEFPHLATQDPGNPNINRGGIHMATGLSTPVAYLMTVSLEDPFVPKAARDKYGNLAGVLDNGMELPYSLGYVNIKLMLKQAPSLPQFSQPAYLLLSLGPDYVRGSIGKPWYYGDYAREPAKKNYFKDMEYDSSNGTKSGGDILMWP